MLSLADYRSVVALYEERHFVRAASVLGVTQPALTSRLRRIETHLGTRLFQRGRGGVEPTAAGISFTESARRILDLAEEAADAARGAGQGLGQTLRLGMTQIAALQVVVPLLDAFRRAHPYARIRLTEGSTARLEAEVEQNLLDAAFVHPPFHQPGLSELPLTAQGLVKFDARPQPGASSPVIRYTRQEAPVLVAEIERKAPNRDGFDATVEVDTALGALVLSQAGYGPCIVPRGFLDLLGPSFSASGETDAGVSGIGIELGTSLVWRSLDRRPMVTELITIGRQLTTELEQG